MALYIKVQGTQLITVINMSTFLRATVLAEQNLLGLIWTVQFLLTTVVCDLLMSRLQHESCCLNQTYIIFATAVHNVKNVIGF